MSNVIYNESSRETPQETSQESLPPLSNQQLHDMVSDLFTEYRTLKRETGAGTTVEARMDACKDVIGLSYRHNGRKPSGSVLDRLGTYLILDHLTDRHPDKMTREETPVQSFRQFLRRFNEVPTDKTIYDPTYFVGVCSKSGGRGEDVEEYSEDMGQNVYVPSVDESVDAINSAIILYDLLERAKLTGRQRQAIDLVYFEDMTQEKAAEVMGVTRQAVELYARNSINKISAVIGRISKGEMF